MFELSPSIIDASLRLLLAGLLGSLVGLEREIRRHPAGLRTHILVSVGSAVFTILSLESLMSPEVVSGVTDQLAMLGSSEGTIRIVRDPARIAAQVVTGIGFIGGGVVLRHGATVRGLTTAASLWIVASIGMLCGSGHGTLSLIATLITVCVLYGLRKLGRRFRKKDQKSFNRLKLSITLQAEGVMAVQTWIDQHFRGRVIEIKTQPKPNQALSMVYVIDVTQQEAFINKLYSELDSMTHVSQSNFRLYYTNLSNEIDD